MDRIKKKPILYSIFEILFIIIGAALSALAIECILVPNSILDGGVNGISIILNLIFGWRLSLLIIIINTPFIYLGFKNLGTKFLGKTVFSILVFSLLLEVFHSLDTITDNMLLATVYGSVLLGVGVGLIIHFGGCLDGTESLGIIISKNTNLSVGQFVLLCNAIIFTVAGFFFGVDRALYSLLAYFITSKVVDEVSEGTQKAKAAMIITNDAKDIADQIYSKIGRTVTTMQGNGLISGEKSVLYCVITRIELPELKRIVREIDSSAFITITDVSEIIGAHIKSNKGLKKRRKKDKNENI